MPDDYQALLARARKDIPDDIVSGERFQLPQVEGFYEGKTTVVKNFDEILDAINRESDHAVPILLREIGTAGTYENGRLTLQGRIPEATITDRIQKYVDTYVICSECGRPDTHLVKEERTLIVQCDACGGHRPVKARKPTRPEDQGPRDAVEEGKTYEVKIEDTGKKGDGVAHLDKFTIFVDNAAVGNVYEIRVNKVTGTLAFAEIVNRIE